MIHAAGPDGWLSMPLESIDGLTMEEVLLFCAVMGATVCWCEPVPSWGVKGGTA